MASAHFLERLTTLEEANKFYKNKSEIAEKSYHALLMQKITDQLQKETARKINSQIHYKPICISKDDDLTEQTAKQILVHNNILNNVNDFTSFCLHYNKVK